MLGAEVLVAKAGQGTLKDAVDMALNYYVEDPNSYYLLGSAFGPHPYPSIVRYFQSVISQEMKTQIIAAEGRLPDRVIACIGGGSNAIGAFSEFLEDDVMLNAAEAGGEALSIGKTAATLSLGKPTVFQGSYSLCLLDEKDQTSHSKSIAAGLDYPGIGPEHAYLQQIERVKYHAVSDSDAIEAYKLLAKTEGIIPAIESAHAVALALKLLKDKGELAIINISGRGDKDIDRL